jgi:hypothetical protein
MMISIHRNQSWRGMGHWLLVLALLLGQSAALAHDHDADKNNDSACALCLFAQQSGHGIPSVIPGLPLQTGQVFRSHSVIQDLLASVVVPFHSRAPPASFS